MDRRHAIVELDGSMNCRDIGGYRTDAGRTVRVGAVYRCDRLSELTDQDRDDLESRGIRAVVDLRTEAEQSRDPSRLWTGVMSHTTLTIGDEIAQQQEYVERIRSGEITSVTVDDVRDSYLGMLTGYPDRWAAFLHIVAELDHLPLLFHCTAGKDRTGLGTMLIHELLGVTRDDVLDDYELTNELRSHRRIAELRPGLEADGVDVEAVTPALSAPRDALRGALDVIDTQWGGVERYATDMLGVDRDAIELIRLQLLV